MRLTKLLLCRQRAEPPDFRKAATREHATTMMKDCRPELTGEEWLEHWMISVKMMRVVDVGELIAEQIIGAATSPTVAAVAESAIDKMPIGIVQLVAVKEMMTTTKVTKTMKKEEEVE